MNILNIDFTVIAHITDICDAGLRVRIFTL
jgi:hypothetical protein